MITASKFRIKKMSNKPVLTPRQYLLSHPDVEVDPRGFTGGEEVVKINQTPFEKMDSLVGDLDNISER